MNWKKVLELKGLIFVVIKFNGENGLFFDSKKRIWV